MDQVALKALAFYPLPNRPPAPDQLPKTPLEVFRQPWSAADAAQSLARNPEAASLKGNWSDPKFLRNLRDLNAENKQTQFADFNGHGWVYRAVFRQDKKGNMLDYYGDKIKDYNAPTRIVGVNLELGGKPVILVVSRG